MARISVWLLIVLLPATCIAEQCKAPFDITSPCQGTVLPPPAALKALKCLKVDLPKAKLVAEEQAAVHKTKMNGLLEQLKAEKKYSSSLDKLLNTALKKTPPTPPRWWEKKESWYAMGVLSGVALSVGVVYALAPAVKQGN